MRLHGKILAALATKFKKDFKQGNGRKPTKDEVKKFRDEITALAEAEPDEPVKDVEEKC